MKQIFLFFLISLLSLSISAAETKVGDSAPVFSLKNQDGKEFKLDSRKGKWTVLYFYPKSETPGCTKQASAFRDGISKVRELKADVFGVSVNSVNDLNLSKLNVSNRWTYLIGPDLKIRSIDKEVDPVMDARKVASNLKEFQTK